MKNTSYWLDESYTARKSLTENITADIVVIGAGITGVSAAYHATNLGFKTILIEKNEVASGSAGKNAGMVVEGIEIDLLEAVEQLGEKDGVEVWRKTVEAREDVVSLIKEHSISCDLERTGSLYAGTSREDSLWLQKEQKARESAGFSCLILSKGENFRNSIFTDELYNPQDCMLHPVKFIRGLAEAGEKMGLQIFENTEAQDFNSTKVKTPGGIITAKNVILAIESSTPDIQGTEAVVSRLQALVTEELDKVQWEKLDWKYGGGFWTTGKGYLTARKIGERLLLTGGKIGMSPSEEDLALGRKELIEELVRYFPTLTNAIPISHHWTGLLVYSRRNRPFISNQNDFVEIFGHGGNGLTNGIMAGKLAAESLAGKEIPHMFLR